MFSLLNELYKFSFDVTVYQNWMSRICLVLDVQPLLVSLGCPKPYLLSRMSSLVQTVLDELSKSSFRCPVFNGQLIV